MPDPQQVRSMFARIAARYDLLNRLLSFGIDRRWRAALLALAGEPRGARVIDVCCGTGDVAWLLAERGARVVGVDFTGEMLSLARGKHAGRGESASDAPFFLRGDAVALPVATGTADVVTIAFGIRNVADRVACLGEMARVLRPGGRLLILEFGSPPGRRLAAAHALYMRKVLPRVGALVSGDADAYRYLPASVAAWPGATEFQREVEGAGYTQCGHRALSGGIAYLHWGTANAPG